MDRDECKSYHFSDWKYFSFGMYWCSICKSFRRYW